MHEISLVQGLLQQLHTIARENGTSRVLKIRMEIGQLSGVVVESFQFGFDILSKEDELVRDAELEIIVPEITYRCTVCGHEEKSLQRPDTCRSCGDRIMTTEEGSDLILQQVEME